MDPKTIKLMNCDFNWAMKGDQHYPATAEDWAFVNSQAYFDWHVDFGCNVIFCQAYAFGGHAYYPTRLGPVAPGPGRELFPALYELGRAAGMPVWSYLCIGGDLVMSNIRQDWVLPGTRDLPGAGFGFLAPETEWTDYLCARLDEFLRMYPVDWLLFDWFIYGWFYPEAYPLRPAPFMEQPFAEIIGRPLPATAEEITLEEGIAYKREVLARQFRRLKDTATAASPGTKLIFNVPYTQPQDPHWVDHPMLQESDGLFAECTRPEVMEWLLEVRRPGQRLMTTIIGRLDDEADPNSWRRWHEAGCDFFGYAWGTPPDFRPHPRYEEGLRVVRKAFREIG